MKKIFLVMLSVFCMLQASDQNSSQLEKEIKEKVIILDDAGEHEIAREIISTSMYFGESSVKDSILFWLKLDEKIFNRLDVNIHDGPTLLPPFKVSDENNIVVEDVAVNQMVDTVPIIGLLKGAYDLANDNTLTQKTYNTWKEKVSYLNECSITCIPVEVAKKKIAQYDMLKKSQKKLKLEWRKYLKSVSNKKELDDYIEILKKLNNFKKKIITRRTNYISYSVVSPYLADAQRNIELSNIDEIIGHNEEYLRKAAKLMAKGAYNNILLQANEDVREQFYKVYQKLKETAGDKELEDLKVLQTLMDSSSKAKKTGADLWWQ